MAVVISCHHGGSVLLIIQDGGLLNYFVCYALCCLSGLLDWFQRKTEKNKSELSCLFYDEASL